MGLPRQPLTFPDDTISGPGSPQSSWWPFCCSRYFRAGSFILQRHSSWINSTNHRSKVTQLGPVLVILTLLLKRDIIILIYTPCHRTQVPYLWICKYSVNIRFQWLICFSSIYGHLTNVLAQHPGLMLGQNVYFKLHFGFAVNNRVITLAHAQYK